MLLNDTAPNIATLYAFWLWSLHWRELRCL